MLKWIGTATKVAFFVAIVLVLGQVLRWEGRTISDQVKTGMAKAGGNELVRSAGRAIDRIAGEAGDAFKKSSAPPAGDEIPETERQKLRALIRELNSTE